MGKKQKKTAAGDFLRQYEISAFAVPAIGADFVTVNADGIQQTIQWYLDNEDWWKHILSGEYSNYFDNMYGKRLGEK